MSRGMVNPFMEFDASLKRGVVAPVYLFYGEETYLRDLALVRLKEYFEQGGQADLDLDVDVIEGETTDPVEVAARAETLPFFAAKRLVVVKNPSFFKSGKRGGKAGEREEPKPSRREAALLEYIKAPSPSTCLVFSTGENVDKRKRLFQAIKKNGRELEFIYLSPGDLSRWVAKRAGQESRRFAPGAANALLDAAGPSLQALSLEIEKLINYTAGRELITIEEVRLLCRPRLEENIFAVMDAVGSKRYREALTGIKDMLAAKEPPLKILSMIARQFRILLMVRDLTERGCPAREIGERLKIHPFVAQKATAQSRNFSKPLLIGALAALSELDVGVKTGKMEFYPAIETFLLTLCARVRSVIS
ncbi:MAG: DNA polymerase III subunit delta [Desulfotomaculaceae bacterium]|nr:DNA polymerase III subunit delta [Desulfotomaculaceae bacterium]